MTSKRRSRRQQALFASLFLLNCVAAGKAPYEAAEHYATITARQAVATQTIVPFYFGPVAFGDPWVDLGTLFVASVVEANETYTAIDLSCQPANGIASGYECNLNGIQYSATQISSATHYHYWVSAGGAGAGSLATSSAEAVVDGCTFVGAESAECVAYKTATEGLLAGKAVTYALESEEYTVAGSLTMDNIPITAGAEKLPNYTPGTTTATTGGNGGGGSGGAASTTTAKPKHNAAGGGKADSVLEGGSTFGLVVGILAWALI